MKKFNCPSCGAEIIFHSSLSVYAVCSYCSSMLVRQDVDVMSIGVMSALPDDMSPLKIGTQGFYNQVRFSLVGRMKMGWRDGSWNEWFMVSDDGRKGWLCEAQGFYAPCFEIDDASISISLDPGESIFEYLQDLKIGANIIVKNKTLRVVDNKYAKCFGSEGELPFIVPKGREVRTIDFLGENAEFLSIEFDGKQYRAYMGNYVEWDDIGFENLRELEGW